MGLIEKLRKAEEQGLSAAQRKLEQARGTWGDAERRLRRKMRLHPRTDAPLPALRNVVEAPVSTDRKVANATLSSRASEEDAA